MPLLIIGGITDLQVDVKYAVMLSKANSNSKLYIIKNMNHILKDVSTIDGKVNFQSYSNPDLVLSEKLSKVLLKFIKGQCVIFQLYILYFTVSYRLLF
jgi:hypothetical protein